MTATMICRAAPGLSGSWLVLTGGPGSWRIDAAHTMLEQAVEAAKGQISHDWTFTTKHMEAALASYAEHPDDLPNLGLDSHAVILCPEGGGVENRWATLHRVPGTGTLVAAGLEGKFRPQLLTERVLEWFVKQQWRSFVTPKVSERHEPVGQQPQRPRHYRELLVRHSWAARAIAAHAFLPIRSGPVVTDEQRARQIAKLPQNRSAVRRQKQQENHSRIRAEAAERARLRGEVA